MGIPRLTQDLSGYTEVAVLGGEPLVNGDQVQISRVVIDGPSLVYHVYDGLLRSMNPSEIGSAIVPTYSDVVFGVGSFIKALESQGVIIEALIFDGDLPIFKRDVRLERMEKMRQQLEGFRKLHHQLQCSDGPASSVTDSSWDARSRPVSNARHALPPLPFLVPAVLDAAKLSGDIVSVRVVPEEADVACARVAKASGAAILTNDSDLALYDLGPNGCVLVLRTATTQEAKASGASQVTSLLKGLQTRSESRVTMSCVRPARIAQRLSLPSLLDLGFERSLDSSVGTSVIVQRAKDSSTDEKKRRKLEGFQQQFHSPDLTPDADCLNSLDPRTSEFVMQAIASSETPQVYLPILHEDPSRDSSWAYGLAYRQLAYSICFSSVSQTGSTLVIENARKGSRIAAASVSVLDKIGIFATVEGMLEDLEGLAERLQAVSREEMSSRYFVSVSEWYAAAICIVLQHKLANGKAALSHDAIDRLFSLAGDVQPESTFEPTWEDMHLLANAQAVLYSWRMLRQIIGWTRAHPSTGASYESKVMSKDIERLRLWLEKMPAVSDLFLNFRQMRTAGSAEERKNAASVVKRLLNQQVVRSVQSHEADEVNKKKRKRAKGTTQPKGREHSLGSNAFALLSEDVTAAADTGDI